MVLTPFRNIRKLAEERKGGKKALESLLASHKPASAKKLAAIPDDRYQLESNQKQVGWF